MELMTLRTMCERLNVSRRSIQCYEQAGLLKPSEKNKYGHLLYDEQAFQRAQMIRFLQQLGFKLEEVKEIIDAPDNVSKKDIFNCIVERMKQQDSEQASDHDMPEDDKERMPEKYETVLLDDFVKYNIMKENIDFYGKSGFRQASEYGIRYHGLPEGYLVDEQEVEEFDRQLTMFFSIFK